MSRKKKKRFSRKCYSCGSNKHLANRCDKKESNSSNGKDKKKDESKKSAFLALYSEAFKASEWYIDSGCSSHMTNDDSGMRNTKPSSVTEIKSACKNALLVKKMGDTTINIGEKGIDIKNVLHVPQVAVNLLSVYQICERGNSVSFDKNGCTIKNESGDLLAFCKPRDGVYKLSVRSGMCMMAQNGANAMTWHRRLGHMNAQSMRKMKNGAVDGVTFRDDDRAIMKCETCSIGKQTRLPFKESQTSCKKLLELVHSDVMGPLEVRSIGHAQYLLTFVDDFSRKVFIYFLKTKDQVFDRFVEFKALVENQTGEKIKILRSDNGGEYVSERLNKLLMGHGIRHQTSTAHTPQQNGVAERMNRTLTEKTRCLLFDANLPKTYWAEAVNMATYIINRSVCTSLKNKTPEEVFTGNKIDLSNLKIFGSEVMVHVPKTNRKKLDRKSKKLIFVGFDSNTKGYRCIDIETRKLTISRDVKFLESESSKTIGLDMGLDSEEDPIDDTQMADEELEDDGDVDDSTEDSDLNNTIVNAEPENNSSETKPNDVTIVSSNDSSKDDTSTDPDFTTRAKTDANGEIRVSERAKKQYIPFQYNLFALMVEPSTVAEARECEQAREWKRAMEEEMHSHADNKTWTLTELPANKKPIKAKWVFKVKNNGLNEKVRFKARLVAKGFSQRPGIDYDETYAPVVRYATLRILFAMTVEQNLRIFQMDAITAFLQGELSETIYMEQPEGFENGTAQVCHLNKAVYGLKQASRAWNLKLNDALLKFGLERSKMDPCVYFNHQRKLFVAIYVDDFLIFYRDIDDLNDLKSKLHDTFKMKDIGEARECLGIRINRKENEIELDQSTYIAQLITKFGADKLKSSKTPGDANVKLSIQQWNEDNDLTGKVPYQELIGSLLYVSERTRPDIAFAVNNASRFNKKHCTEHWEAVLRILKYLRGTMNAKLIYRSRTDGLHAFSDADWASDIDKRRSCTGYVLIMSGGAITWRSQRQETVAQSSTEAEYLALSSTVNEIKWVTQFIDEINNANPRTTTLYCDNQSAIKLGTIEAFRERTKHIDLRHHHIRDQVEAKLIKLDYISTNEMTADILTKPLTGDKTEKLARKMGLTFIH